VKSDFTTKVYKELLITLLSSGYTFQTFHFFLESPEKKKVIILRHDVDRRPENTHKMAQIEHMLDIKSSYYFRIVKESRNLEIIKKIANFGHEIGYHYEDLSLAKGDYEKAFESFQKNLEYFRQFYPVKTICMHGSPLSKWDNRLLWERYDYRDFGIIGEPYFDLDFNEVLYLTDTGRRWDGDKYIVRDKVTKKPNWDIRHNEIPVAQRILTFHSTHNIIKAGLEGRLPDKIMLTFHPQRWHDKLFPWFKELALQNTRNVIKRYFFVKS